MGVKEAIGGHLESASTFELGADGEGEGFILAKLMGRVDGAGIRAHVVKFAPRFERG